TPYVMSNLEEMQGQTERLYRGTSLKQEDWGQENWSESKLRQIPDPEEEPTAQNTTSSDLESQATATAEKDEMIDLLNSMDQ
ncbi:MAG: hypothetical protein DRP64_12635, partial [Verrucomicrobia bacterium]